MAWNVTPAQFAKDYYTPDGTCVTCEGGDPRALEFLNATAESAKAPNIGEALQIKPPWGLEPNAVGRECIRMANDTALANPAWSKKVGHKGLIRLQAACYYEAQGIAPAGFAQGVASEMLAAQGIPTWVYVAGAAGLALLLLRRK